MMNQLKMKYYLSCLGTLVHKFQGCHIMKNNTENFAFTKLNGSAVVKTLVAEMNWAVFELNSNCVYNWYPTWKHTKQSKLLLKYIKSAFRDFEAMLPLNIQTTTLG